MSKGKKKGKTLVNLSGDKNMSIVGVDSSDFSAQHAMIFPHDAFGVRLVDLKNDIRKVDDRRKAVVMTDLVQVDILTGTAEAAWYVPVDYSGWRKWCTPSEEKNGKCSRTESCCSTQEYKEECEGRLKASERRKFTELIWATTTYRDSTSHPSAVSAAFHWVLQVAAPWSWLGFAYLLRNQGRSGLPVVLLINREWMDYLNCSSYVLMEYKCRWWSQTMESRLAHQKMLLFCPTGCT